MMGMSAGVLVSSDLRLRLLLELAGAGLVARVWFLAQFPAGRIGMGWFDGGGENRSSSAPIAGR